MKKLSKPEICTVIGRLACLSLFFTNAGCSGVGPQIASVQSSQWITCFPAEKLQAEKPPTCELSAVAKAEKILVFANDKAIPDGSPVFAERFDGSKVDDKPDYFKIPDTYIKSSKYEGMATTPDGAWVIATTAFDRFDPNKPDWNAYNRILAWPAGHHDQPQVLIGKTEQDIDQFRKQIKKTVTEGGDKLGYFKIEGVAAIPAKSPQDNTGRLLFGIRELGESYDKFNYARKLVEVGYTIANNQISLGSDYKLKYQFDVSPEDKAAGVPQAVGLSSVEYDPANKRLYLLTSFEQGEESSKKLGAYLWVLDEKALESEPGQQAHPVLIKDAITGKPVKFAHKAEGLAVLGGDRIVVIFDDDRVTKFDGEPDRKLNESLYQVIQLQ